MLVGSTLLMSRRRVSCCCSMRCRETRGTLHEPQTFSVLRQALREEVWRQRRAFLLKNKDDRCLHVVHLAPQNVCKQLVNTVEVARVDSGAPHRCRGLADVARKSECAKKALCDLPIIKRWWQAGRSRR